MAIKTIKVENLSEEAAADYEARFRTEARSAARLQHPNIVSVYDSDRHGDMAYLVMEFILGEDLKHHLDGGKLYSLEQSLRMVRDLLSALEYAHRQNIVHRDVKPANLLIEADGRVKLTDFGVARIQDSGEATRTQGSIVGTLKYMSPEQVQGQPIDARADLFAAGIVLSSSSLASGLLTTIPTSRSFSKLSVTPRPPPARLTPCCRRPLTPCWRARWPKNATSASRRRRTLRWPCRMPATRPLTRLLSPGQPAPSPRRPHT